MLRTVVEPGVCGMDTEIRVEGDMMSANIVITSDCPHIKKLATEVTSASPVQDVFKNFASSDIYRLAAEHCPHLACPVPMAIVKSLEIAGGLALPQDVKVTFYQE